MVHEEYSDADFNMRAIFYQQTAKDSRQRKLRKPIIEPVPEKPRQKGKSHKMRLDRLRIT